MNSYVHDLITLYFSSNYRFGLAIRLVFLTMGEMLSFGFNLAVSSPSDIVGVARHVLYFFH